MAEKSNRGKDEKKTLFDKLAENELYRKIIVVACVAGIALIFLSGFFKITAALPHKPLPRSLPRRQTSMPHSWKAA